MQNFQQACRQRLAATRSCGLATEFSPLPKTKIGKKGEQLTENQQFRVTAVGRCLLILTVCDLKDNY